MAPTFSVSPKPTLYEESIANYLTEKGYQEIYVEPIEVLPSFHLFRPLNESQKVDVDLANYTSIFSTGYKRMSHSLLGEFWCRTRVAEIADEWSPPTFSIFGKDCVPVNTSAKEMDQIDNNDKVWFLKEEGVQLRQGVSLHNSLKDCLVHAQCGRQYVAQPHVPNPWRLEGCKVDTRCFLFGLSRAGSLGIECYLYGKGAHKVFSSNWEKDSTDPDVQCQNPENSTRIPFKAGQLPVLAECLNSILSRADWNVNGSNNQNKTLTDRDKDMTSFGLIGVDFICDQNGIPRWILEFNPNPGLNDGWTKIMVREMADIVFGESLEVNIQKTNPNGWSRIF